MTKTAALNAFYKNFGIPAYPVTEVPDGATFPYLTYEVKTGKNGQVVSPKVELWYYTKGEKEINAKSEQISKYIGLGKTIPCDDGIICVYCDNPWDSLKDQAYDNIKRRYTTLTMYFETF